MKKKNISYRNVNEMTHKKCVRAIFNVRKEYRKNLIGCSVSGSETISDLRYDEFTGIWRIFVY